MKIHSASNLIDEMRRMAEQAGGSDKRSEQNSSVGFSQLLSKAMENVNELQNEAEKLGTAFELGDDKVDLAQVMLASQKADLSFQAMVQVRNKLISAYQEIMRMQI